MSQVLAGSSRAACKAMGTRKLNIVVAVEQNKGIGYKGSLPWPRLRTDLQFLQEKTSNTVHKEKKNAIIMGRKTWESLPVKKRPLKNRFNIVLSSRSSSSPELAGAHLVCSSLSRALEALSSAPLLEEIESVFVLGGSSVYKEAMKAPECDRVYVTEVLANFPADVFFHYECLDENFKIVSDETVPQGIIEENGVKFCFKTYQKV